MEAILKVENLTKVFTRKGQPDFTAVDHIGFELYPGECLGLIPFFKNNIMVAYPFGIIFAAAMFAIFWTRTRKYA